HIEALNHALTNVPAEQARVHLCWGNYEGPHHYDVPLADILDIVFRAKPAGKVISPGVIDSTTNFIEHPELIAERVTKYATLVGREHVLAGSDCGFGT